MMRNQGTLLASIASARLTYHPIGKFRRSILVILSIYDQLAREIAGIGQ
jgi:hypothetical protein